MRVFFDTNSHFVVGRYFTQLPKPSSQRTPESASATAWTADPEDAKRVLVDIAYPILEGSDPCISGQFGENSFPRMHFRRETGYPGKAADVTEPRANELLLMVRYSADVLNFYKIDGVIKFDQLGGPMIHVSGRSLYHKVAHEAISRAEYLQNFFVETSHDCQGPETLFRQICDRVKCTNADFRLEVTVSSEDAKEDLELCLFRNPRFGFKLHASLSSGPGMVQSYPDEAHLDWTALWRPADIFFRLTNESDIDDITGPRGSCSDLSGLSAFTSNFQGFEPK